MQRIPSLDGLRAISISLVVLCHLNQWKHISLPVMEPYGDLGVHIFFVLSGFLITKLLLEEHGRSSTISLREFYVRRAFRIFPAALAFIAVATAFYWHEIRWPHLATALFYVANMDVARPWIFGHLWSLSIEEQFYLLWPLALKTWHRNRTAILLAVFFATPIFRTALYAFHVRSGLAGSLPAYADQLAIGCLLALLAPRLPRVRAAWAALMFAAMVLIPWYPANSQAGTIFMLFILRPLLSVSIAGVILHVIQVPYRALHWAPVVWLGKVSYSLYLWQEVFCSNNNLRLGYAAIPLALGAASLSYYLVEQPMLRLRDLRSTSQGGRSATPVTSAPQPAMALSARGDSKTA